DRLFRWIDRFGDRPRRLDDRAVLHAGRARRLTGAAIQAGVYMRAEVGIVSADLAFVDLADLVDAAAGRVGFVAENAVGRTIVQAQAAVDALLEELLIEDLVQGIRVRYRQRTVRDSACFWGPTSL